jgi:hypothetical protein
MADTSSTNLAPKTLAALGDSVVIFVMSELFAYTVRRQQSDGAFSIAVFTIVGCEFTIRSLTSSAFLYSILVAESSSIRNM